MVSSVDLKHRPVSHSRICGGRSNEAFRHLPDPFQFEFRVCDLPLVPRSPTPTYVVQLQGY